MLAEHLDFRNQQLRKLDILEEVSAYRVAQNIVEYGLIQKDMLLESHLEGQQ